MFGNSSLREMRHRDVTMLPYSLLSNKTVSSHQNHTYRRRVIQPIKNKHACTHGHMHTLWSMYTHTHTSPNVHANTDTDATKQQQPEQQSDDNYCSCGVDAWRKCLWTADESAVRWHHALNRQTAEEFLQGLSRRSRTPMQRSSKTEKSDTGVESGQTAGCSTTAEKQRTRSCDLFKMNCNISSWRSWMEIEKFNKTAKDIIKVFFLKLHNLIAQQFMNGSSLNEWSVVKVAKCPVHTTIYAIEVTMRRHWIGAENVKQPQQEPLFKG